MFQRLGQSFQLLVRGDILELDDAFIAGVKIKGVVIKQVVIDAVKQFAFLGIIFIHAANLVIISGVITNELHLLTVCLLGAKVV